MPPEWLKQERRTKPAMEHRVNLLYIQVGQIAEHVQNNTGGVKETNERLDKMRERLNRMERHQANEERDIKQLLELFRFAQKMRQLMYGLIAGAGLIITIVYHSTGVVGFFTKQ